MKEARYQWILITIPVSSANEENIGANVGSIKSFERKIISLLSSSLNLQYSNTHHILDHLNIILDLAGIIIDLVGFILDQTGIVLDQAGIILDNVVIYKPFRYYTISSSYIIH